MPAVCVRVKRDLLIWQKRPTYMAKEAYLHGKRGLLIWQKRPTNSSFTACQVLEFLSVRINASVRGKRGLLVWQKRPTYMAKEAYKLLLFACHVRESLAENSIASVCAKTRLGKEFLYM